MKCYFQMQNVNIVNVSKTLLEMPNASENASLLNTKNLLISVLFGQNAERYSKHCCRTRP